MNTIRVAILFGTLGIFLFFINSGIITSERNIENATVAYLDLAPRDPRSLIQGDFMQLAYAIERDANSDATEDRGQLVVSLDDSGIVSYERVYDATTSLADNEMLINYFEGRRAIRVGVDSFFFQEGQADDYARARYAEVRILENGGVMLINLTDENLVVINPD
ncbi:MAG: GDYXXLXY domain-containing protein [Phototrophicaceae bacterium]